MHLGAVEFGEEWKFTFIGQLVIEKVLTGAVSEINTVCIWKTIHKMDVKQI